MHVFSYALKCNYVLPSTMKAAVTKRTEEECDLIFCDYVVQIKISFLTAVSPNVTPTQKDKCHFLNHKLNYFLQPQLFPGVLPV